MSTQPVETRATRRCAVALLTQPVDAAGVQHIAFETARRTLCLEHFVSDCSSDRGEHVTCATCIDVRQRMKRPRFKATQIQEVGVATRGAKEAAMTVSNLGQDCVVSRKPRRCGSTSDRVRPGAMERGTSETRRGRSAVVLDKHPVWVDALNNLLGAVGVEVVGRGTGTDETITLVAELRPDLVVAGLEVSDPDQVGFVRRVKLEHPGLKTVILADTTDPSVIEAVFAAGASVYCVKTAETDDLAWAIRQALEQSVYIAQAHQEFSSVPMQAPDQVVAHELTRRELEILRLVADGHSNGHLAKMLWVTEQTVKFHLSNIYRKLHVANRTEASRWAQLNGLLHTSPREERLAGSPRLALA